MPDSTAAPDISDEDLMDAVVAMFPGADPDASRNYANRWLLDEFELVLYPEDLRDILAWARRSVVLKSDNREQPPEPERAR